MIRLTTQQVKMLHRDVIAQSGGSPEIRDEGLLESALHAPFQTFAGIELCTQPSWKKRRIWGTASSKITHLWTETKEFERM